MNKQYEQETWNKPYEQTIWQKNTWTNVTHWPNHMNKKQHGNVSHSQSNSHRNLGCRVIREGSRTHSVGWWAQDAVRRNSPHPFIFNRSVKFSYMFRLEILGFPGFLRFPLINVHGCSVVALHSYKNHCSWWRRLSWVSVTLQSYKQQRKRPWLLWKIGSEIIEDNLKIGSGIMEGNLKIGSEIMIVLSIQ